METIADTLRRVMKGTAHAEGIATALLERAEAGDLKAVQMVLQLLGEDLEGKDPGENVVHIKLGRGVRELAR